MAYTCTTEKQGKQAVLSIRTRVPAEKLPQKIGESYMTIAKHLETLGEHPSGAPYVAYYNMDMTDLDVEIGMPTALQLPEGQGIDSGQMAEGTYVTTIHTGPYDQLKTAYDHLMAYMESEGFRPSGPAYEIYLNDPGELPPDQLQTKVLFPVVKK